MNSRRMNRLEELGRVNAEKAKTKMGARNLRDEKSRIIRELKADGGLMEPKEHKKRRKEKKERAKDPATGKAMRKAGLQSSYGKGRNPMKRERLKEAFAPGKKLVLRSERIKKADGGKVKGSEHPLAGREGNVKHRLKSQKQYKAITDTKKYKDASYGEKNKMLAKGGAYTKSAPDKKGRISRADGGKVKGVKEDSMRDRMKQPLKKVQPNQKGLKKLPTKVRNKMGYMKKGGRVGMGKALRGGGCVR